MMAMMFRFPRQEKQRFISAAPNNVDNPNVRVQSGEENKTGPDRQGVAALARGIFKVQQVCVFL
jgi:hypothetical protein